MSAANPPPRVVLFDLGGVVCLFEPAPRLAALAADCGLPESEVHARVWDSGLTREFDVGRYTSLEWYDLLCEQLGLRMDRDRFETVFLSAVRPNLEVLAVVDEVRARCRVAMLTDNPTLLLEALPVRYPELLGRFDPMLFSCELRLLKPSPEIFALALDRIGEPAEAVLFIDDAPANVEAARTAGMRAEVFTDAARLRADLVRHGVL